MRRRIAHLKARAALEKSPAQRRRRSKADWAGIHYTDAFKQNLDLFDRFSAQRMFYEMAGKLQAIAAKEFRGYGRPVDQTKTMPQIAPCYTSYPAALAVYASLGLTAFLEFQSRMGKDQILYCRLIGLAETDVTLALYPERAAMVARIVETRLLLHCLSSLPSMWFVEAYRLFAASQHSIRFQTVREIVQAVVLFGDVFLTAENLRVHPLTKKLLTELTTCSEPFFDELDKHGGIQLFDHGSRWVCEICNVLAKYDPDQKKETKTSGREGEKYPWLQSFNERRRQKKIIPPIDAPQPPQWSEPVPRDEKALLRQRSSRTFDQEASMQIPQFYGNSSATIDECMKVIRSASKQKNSFEDIRFDLMERRISRSPFQAGPLEGAAVDSHHVKFGDQNTSGGYIFDRPLPVKHNDHAYDLLLADSAAVTNALKQALYPDVARVMERHTRCTSGSMDPARLAVSNFSSSVYRRYGSRERLDRRGEAVVLIACDASGSLDSADMKMAKILTAAWLNSTVHSQVRVLAALFHSDRIHGIENAPLVQWIFHPSKTSGITRKDALHALAGLPASGTGIQSDALSLSFLLQEARQFARGRMVYLILISDCQWNRSLNRDMDGEAEMVQFFAKVYRHMPRLHITLAALDPPSDAIEQLVDKVILLTSNEDKPDKIAGEVAEYVASVMAERRILIQRSKC